jgi:hypothetical protein
MLTLDALEAINVDQLVTASDRLHLRCARVVQRPGSRSTIDFSREAQAALAASKAKAKANVVEKTEFVRPHRHSKKLLGAAAMIVGAWLGVVCACLLT